MKTEYEVMRTIEKWIANEKCNICGSTNIEVFDISVNDWLLYDFNRISKSCIKMNKTMFILTIEKENSSVVVNPSGSKRIEREFLQSVLMKILYFVKNSPDYQFKSHQKGYFEICLTGKYNPYGNDEIQIERYTGAGLTKAEIYQAVKEFGLDCNIFVYIPTD